MFPKIFLLEDYFCFHKKIPTKSAALLHSYHLFLNSLKPRVDNRWLLLQKNAPSWLISPFMQNYIWIFSQDTFTYWVITYCQLLQISMHHMLNFIDWLQLEPAHSNKIYSFLYCVVYSWYVNAPYPHEAFYSLVSVVMPNNSLCIVWSPPKSCNDIFVFFHGTSSVTINVSSS